MGLAVGRTRSSRFLICVLMIVCPMVTAIRNSGSQWLGRRIISMTNTATVKPTMTPVLPNDVTKSSIDCANDVMCSSPHGATERSMCSRLEFDRTRKASTPSTTPPDDEDHQREQQEEPGLGLRVDAPRQLEAAAWLLVLAFELVRDRARGARRRRVDAGVPSHREGEQRAQHESGTEEEKGDEQSELPAAVGRA